MIRNPLLIAVAGSLFALAPVQAQSVFALPGQAGTAALGSAYGTHAFATPSTFSAPAGAYRVLATPNADRFFVFTGGASNALYLIQNGFQTVNQIAGFSAPVTSAVITPDGLNLYVAAGSLRAFHVADTTVIPLTTSLPAGSLVGLDASLDATQIFILTSTGSSSTLASLSTVTQSVTATVPVLGQATSVVVGPNALVYVSTTNGIYEIDPNTHAILNQYAMQGQPGAPVFTPDGHYLVVANQSAGSSTAVESVDLFAHAVAGTIPTSSLPPGAVLDTLFGAGNNLAIAYSTGQQSLFDITIAPLAITSAPYVTTGTKVNAAAVTLDAAAGSNTTSQYLFYAAGNLLTRVTLATLQPSGTVSLTTPPGSLAVTEPVFSGTAGEFLLYGNNQTVQAGTTSQPLAVRVLDGSGNPQAQVNVSFTAPSGILLSTPSINTNNLGYAITTLTPATTYNGPVTVGVTIASQTESFSATVTPDNNGGGGSGSGGGTPTGTINAVAGQGQILYQYHLASLAGSPFQVQVLDANGNPVVNTPVTFTLTKGVGVLKPYNNVGQSTSLTTVVAPTDSNGIASTDFLAEQVPAIPGYDQEIITAVSGSLSAVLYCTTITEGNSIIQGSEITIQRVLPEYGITITGGAGTTIAGAMKFQVLSNAGSGIPNVGMVLVPSGNPATTPSATCAGNPLSDSNGYVTCDVVLNGVLGISSVVANVGYFESSLPIPIQITPGPPAKFTILKGDGQSGKPGTQLPTLIVAQLTDNYGNPLASVPVTFTVASGAATLGYTSTQTDTAGKVQAVVTLGKIPGPATITVSANGAGGTVTATFTETVVVIPGALNVVSGSGQSALTGAAFTQALVAQALDNQGNPIPGVPVTFAVTAGSATLSSTSATTDSNGNATVNVTAGADAGPVTVTASYGGFTATYTLTVTPPGPVNVVFLNGASFSSNGAAPGSVTPGAIMAITGDNLTPGVSGVVTPPAGPLPTTLGGVQVLFGGIAAPIFAVVNSNGQQQINVLVPFELGATTSTTVTITNSAGSATLLNVPVTPFDPGIFETSINGQRYAVMVRTSDGSYIGPKNPALPGDTIIVFAEGLGQATPVITTSESGIANQVLQATVNVSINGTPFTDVSAVYQPQVFGVYLVSFQVPSGLATGVYPLSLSETSNGQTYNSQSSYIPVGAPAAK